MLHKGTVTFSCILTSLPEMEAHFEEAEEPRDASASASSWGGCAAEGSHCRMG